MGDVFAVADEAATIDAQALIDALRKAGLPVKGLIIKDVNDTDTWVFQGLNDEQRLKAIEIVVELLHPIEIPPPVQPMTLRAFIQLFQPDEWTALRRAADADAVFNRSILLADHTFMPNEFWLVQLMTACVEGKVLTQDRADAILLRINPPA